MEQQSIKVYELAKELGVDSLSLLEKLNGLEIRVKNHMSDLTAPDVEKARAFFKKKDAPAAPAKKASAPRVRKKATATTDTAAPAAAPASTPASAAADTSGGKSASPVIRRRVKSDGAVEMVATQGTLPTRTHPTEAVHGHEDEQHYEVQVDANGEMILTEEQYAQLGEVVEVPVESTEQEQIVASTTGTVESTESSSDATPAGSVSAAPTSGAVASTTPAAPKITRTVIIPASTAAPKPIIPAAPVRRILQVVEGQKDQVKSALRTVSMPKPEAKEKSTYTKGTTTQDKDGFRSIKLTKENLDQMVEEEAAKRRGPKELDIRPEDVNFADYRKKEMVFLPKRKKIPVGKELRKTNITEMKAEKRYVEMGESISVADLADQLKVKAPEIIKKLMMMGQRATINQALDLDTATLISSEYKYEVRNVAFNEEQYLTDTTEDAADDSVSRPPVVTIMGHVDHGKTSLLDAIREANVAAGEAGGITQHIGAYTIEKNKKLITFIDTPGHEAFTAMRARGANVTDIVVLVVAADDGVMPQTREALAHAKAAGVPIVVAVNKIDKPGANAEKPKQALAELDLLAEDWGGDTMFVPVSALKRTNIGQLLDAILLQAEMLDLKANPKLRAVGTVLEASLSKGKGPVATVLVKKGTLKVGDALLSGIVNGKVKAMVDHLGRQVRELKPGMAAEVLGFEAVPGAGDTFHVVKDESAAATIVEYRVKSQKEKAAIQNKISLEDIFAKIQAGQMKELPVILKADVFGSAEAIRESLAKLPSGQVKVKVIHTGTGGVTESDVLLATASNAVIVGFNVRPETKARDLAEREHIEIKCYNIIYELIDDVKKAMAGLLEKKKVEKYLGRAEVRQTFVVPKMGTIAGSFVVDGKIQRGANVRLLRESRVIYEGKMHSLRRFKDDAREVAQGYECGIGIENYNDLKIGDLIEAYEIELVAPELNA